MEKGAAEKVVEIIESWWQERRNTVAMDTETHNREFEAVEALKARIMATVPADEPPADKKTK